METFEENQQIIPYCACFIVENKEFILYYNEKNKNIILDSLDLICSETNETYIEVYVHNLNFDGLLIIDEITKKKIKFNLKSNRTNIYFIEIFYINKTIKFRCSYKIIPVSLRKLGEIENFPKKYFPYKFASLKTLNYCGPIPSVEFWEKNEFELFKHNEKNLKLFNFKKISVDYCLNDVILLKKILSNILPIIEEEGKNLIKNVYSSASLSHKLFYKKYNDKNIPIKIKKVDENYIRSAYFGGRCEVFGNIYENEHIKYFDFTGMYGQCMLESFHNGEGSYSIKNDYNKPGFHTIEYESNFSLLPILPSHSENGKLMFTNGKKIGTFWFEEIKLFKEYGGKITKVISSYVYEKFEDVFSNFINRFNEIRKKEGYYKIFAKLVINSLYGSMALKSDDDFFYITFSEDEYYSILEKMNITVSYSLNSVYIIIIKNDYKSYKYFNKTKKKIKIDEDDLSKRNVSYSAAIASKARIKLYKAFKEVEKDGGRVLYCDTDSIFAAYSKENKSLKAVTFDWLNLYEDGVFISPKTYALRSKIEEIKIKGVRINEMSFDEIKKKFYNEESILFKEQLNFKKLDFNLRQVYIEKKIALSTYDKRKFLNNKKETVPLTL